jgi:hypothetical protein
VNGGLNRLLAAAFVAGVFAAGTALIAAPAALACSGGPSAYNVYKECLSSGGSGKHGGGSGKSTPNGGSQSGTTAPSAKVSKNAQKALSQAGKDRAALSELYKTGGGVRLLQASHGTSPSSEPTAIGSAFDLGTGPTALLIALAATAVLMIGMTGVRGVRRRR